MATYLIFHEVEDVDAWKSATTRQDVFGPVGVTVRIFTDPQGSNSVGLLTEIPDMDAFMSVMNSPQGQDAMAKDGVRPETLVLLAEV